MNVPKFGHRWLAAVALCAVAPIVFAQASPGAGGGHKNPAWQACKKQADDQQLAKGSTERRNFMQKCIKSIASPGDTGKQ